MLGCGYECHMVGGPWIAENPACPFHGSNAHYIDTRELEMISAGDIEALWMEHCPDNSLTAALRFAEAVIEAYRLRNDLA